MSTFFRYSIYPCRFGDIVLRDMSEFSFRSASNKSSVIPGGDLHPRAVVNCCADPMATFSTKDFDGVFGGGSSVNIASGYAVTSGTASTLLQFQQRADGASFTGSAGNTVGTNTKGFLHVSDISAQQDDTAGAKIGLEYFLLSSDGTTSPSTWSASQSLVSTPNFDGIWYLGPVRIGAQGASSTMSGVQSVTINPGINFRAPRADGMVFPQNGSIYSVVPEIRIRTLDPTALGTILSAPYGNAFAASSTSFLIYFQKGVHGGSRVATTTASHCLFTALTGDNTTDSISVQQLDDATTEIIIRPINGTMTMTTGQQIT